MQCSQLVKCLCKNVAVLRTVQGFILWRVKRPMELLTKTELFPFTCVTCAFSFTEALL